MMIIDRFEGNYAVCEHPDKTHLNIPRDLLPPNAKEGDCLVINPDGNYHIDADTTKERRERIRKKMNRLFE